jgi:hypothetical protein
MKAQVSIEVFILFAFIVFLMIPALFFVLKSFYDKHQDLMHTYAFSQAYEFAEAVKLVERSDVGSVLFHPLILPPNVQSLVYSGSDAALLLTFKSGEKEYIPLSSSVMWDNGVVVNGGGAYWLKLERTENGVRISSS